MLVRKKKNSILSTLAESVNLEMSKKKVSLEFAENLPSFLPGCPSLKPSNRGDLDCQENLENPQCATDPADNRTNTYV